MKRSNSIARGFTAALWIAFCGHAVWAADVPTKAPVKAPAAAVPTKPPAVAVPAKAPAKAQPAAVPAKPPAKAPVVPAPANAPVAAAAPAKTSAKAPAAAPVKAPAAPAKTPEAAAPVDTASPESYSYNPAGKPDPFVPFVERDIMMRKKAEKSTASSIFPLQNAPVDQFKLVGIAGSERRRIAVVEDERGKNYTLREGTVIGQNNGRVKSILADRVIVEEKIGTDSGKVKINRITVRLHKEDNEGKP